MSTLRVRALASGALLATLLTAGSLASAGGSTSFTVGDLVAGQNELIGSIDVTFNADDTLTVTYDVTEPGWCMTRTHLYVGDGPPAKAAPGSFPHKTTHDPCVTSFSYTVPWGGGCVTIAAHADVETEDATALPDLTDFCDSLPTGLVSFMTTRSPVDGWDADSYLGIKLSGAGEYDGYYDGFCVDASKLIGFDIYSAEMICTYSQEFLDLDVVGLEGNIDLVNWILNQDYVGQTSPGGHGTYTYGDVQVAIWELVGRGIGNQFGPTDENRIDEIVGDALASGEGFEPDCDQLAGVVLRPVAELGGATSNQPVIIGIPLACTTVFRGETAWAYGCSQFNKGWGWYQTYCP